MEPPRHPGRQVQLLGACSPEPWRDRSHRRNLPPRTAERGQHRSTHQRHAAVPGHDFGQVAVAVHRRQPGVGRAGQVAAVQHLQAGARVALELRERALRRDGLLRLEGGGVVADQRPAPCRCRRGAQAARKRPGRGQLPRHRSVGARPARHLLESRHGGTDRGRRSARHDADLVGRLREGHLRRQRRGARGPR